MDRFHFSASIPLPADHFERAKFMAKIEAGLSAAAFAKETEHLVEFATAAKRVVVRRSQ